MHRRVCLVLTEDAVLAEELLARKKLAPRMLSLAMEPALARNEGLIIRRVDDALDDVARVWERA